MTERDDIFALRTVLYEISIGHRLYAEKNDDEIFTLFQNHEFPDTSGLPRDIRTIVGKCWNGGYSNVQEIQFDLSQRQSCKLLTSAWLTVIL